jgi:hypothetical protein
MQRRLLSACIGQAVTPPTGKKFASAARNLAGSRAIQGFATGCGLHQGYLERPDAEGKPPAARLSHSDSRLSLLEMPLQFD